MPEQFNKTEEAALRLMRVLEATPPLNQRELAEPCGISLGSLNYCLKALIAMSLVIMQNFAQSQNKLGYDYVLAPSGMAAIADITHLFLSRKQQEYEALNAVFKARQSEVEKSGRQGTQKA